MLLVTSACTGLGPRVPGPAPYRAPSVVLAYPARGAALPADNAFLVFRFARGEADDPIDAGSFRATVDGVDRTALFQLTDAEAWARLGDSVRAPVVTSRPHVVGARICSARGACGALTVAVDVRPWERVLAPNGFVQGAGPRLPNNTPIVSVTAAAPGSPRARVTGA